MNSTASSCLRLVEVSEVSHGLQPMSAAIGPSFIAVTGRFAFCIHRFPVPSLCENPQAQSLRRHLHRLNFSRPQPVSYLEIWVFDDETTDVRHMQTAKFWAALSSSGSLKLIFSHKISTCQTVLAHSRVWLLSQQLANQSYDLGDQSSGYLIDSLTDCCWR